MSGSVGAPLLAGFTVALIGIVIGYGPHTLAPGAALLLLSSAAVTLLSSVQLCFKARTYAVTPAEIDAWWPGHDQSPRREQLLQEQAEHARRYDVWIRRFRWAYNAGILLLLAGVAVTLMPPPHHHVVERWAAVAVLVVAFCAEVAWVVGDWAEGLGREWWRLR